MKVPMKRLALSLFCVWAVSSAADARAQWWSSWYSPGWTSSYYAPSYYGSYYGPTYYGSYYSPSYGSYYGSYGYGCGYGGCGTGYGCSTGSCGYGGSCYGGSCGYGSCGTGSCGYGCGSSCGYGSCGYGCGSSCGYGSCGSSCGYNNFGCGSLCSAGACNNCGCSPCVCQGGECGAGCSTGNAPLDKSGQPTPAPDNNFRPALPNKTLPDKTYDESGARPPDSDFRGRPATDGVREPRTPMDRLENPLNRRGNEDLFESKKPPLETVPQQRKEENEEGSRPALPGPTAKRIILVSAPATPMSLDDKSTWRAAPERTRMKIRTTFTTPVVARSTIESNSDWAPVSAETKIVRK